MGTTYSNGFKMILSRLNKDEFRSIVSIHSALSIIPHSPKKIKRKREGGTYIVTVVDPSPM